jgi:O-antigen biosynthesis protein
VTNVSITIGVHVHAEPDRLVDTVRSLQLHAPGADVVLLADGPDEATEAAIAGDVTLSGLTQWGTSQAIGAAACLNRLATRSVAEVLVLLESGSIAGPGWLDLMIQAVNVPGRGLAGPSTNRSWNEQATFPGGRGDPEHVRQTAALAVRRFGASARSLRPLYSLADFCYLVRREVIERIGGADEAYGLGPCWEMDYNIRAARAGFDGVWVPGAYVYRHPMTPRRQAEETARMDASRRLYQDRFCGLQLRAERTGYEPHCRGDQCEHFAPRHLITLTRPVLSEPRRTSVTLRAADLPRVSCLMPTRGRPDLAGAAIRYFLSQDYPNKELIIVEDGTAQLAPLLVDDPRVCHVATGAVRSIGAMRNHACELASGEILAQWDDDDWHGPQRLSRQVAAIITGTADITALRDTVMFDLPAWRFWRCSPQLHRRLFLLDVHGRTLVYRREVWDRLARYPDVSLAEDAAFLDLAVRRGARLHPLEGDGLFVYVRHGTNAWRLEPGHSVDPAGWQVVEEPTMPSADRAFYAARSPSAPAQASTHELPMVSCIMPTSGRRPFVAQAIAYFLRQDYSPKELVIVDDGPLPVEDLVPPHPSIIYRRLGRQMILGAKRNLACELGSGQLIAHWDDDDWMAPHRLRTQVGCLQRDTADLCGASRLLFYDPVGRAAWHYAYPGGRRPWVAGATLCYTRALWSRSPFAGVAVGEDTRFVWSPAVKTVTDISDEQCLVAILHETNSAAKAIRGARWTPYPVEQAEQLLGDDLCFYQSLNTEASTRSRPYSGRSSRFPQNRL